MNWTVALLKWLSQLLIIASSISALLQENKLRVINGHRRLTRAGWIHVIGLVVGFGLFGATELKDQLKAAADRAAAKTQAENQQKLLDAATKVQAAQEDELQTGHELVNAQKLVIDNQSKQNQHLKDILLSSYEIAGLQVTLSPRTPAPKLLDNFKLVPSLVTSGPPDPLYFSTCLKYGKVHAQRAASGEWRIECEIARPLGIAHPVYVLTTQSEGWKAVRALWESQFAQRFAIQFAEGDDLVVATSETLPSELFISPGEFTILFREPHVKLNRLSDANVTLRLDSEGMAGKPFSVRLHSLDPAVKLEQILTGRWDLRQYGTAERAIEPGESETVPLRAAMAGPFKLKVKFEKSILRLD